mmetsp:Transcript_5719/g.13749  ORF Transcript_5719/g.13749 Transcript_5719/m.13749 type:complete len:148 (-) Transcript_5719:1039-1482(-)
MTSSHVALSVQEASAADVSGNARARSVVWIGVEEDEDEVGAALVEEEEVGRGGVVLVEGAGVDVDVEGVGVEDDDEDGWTPLVVAGSSAISTMFCSNAQTATVSVSQHSRQYGCPLPQSSTSKSRYRTWIAAPLAGAMVYLQLANAR